MPYKGRTKPLRNGGKAEYMRTGWITIRKKEYYRIFNKKKKAWEEFIDKLNE